MPREDTHLVDITAELKYETELAWLLDDGTVCAWVPKSVCERNGKTEWTMPERVAIDKEFC